MLNCGHCIKTAHHALLMLVGVLALELLAHRVAELHVRRWVVGRCAAWRALEPLRAPSGRGRLAKRFGGRAWLAHLGYYGRGCAHTEREGASSGGKEQCGASDGRICKEGAKSSGEHPMAGCKEEVLLLNHMQHAGTQSRGTGLHHTRAAAAEHCFGQERRSTRCAQVLARCQGFWSRVFGPSSPSSLRRNVPHFGQRAIDAYHLGHVLGSC